MVVLRYSVVQDWHSTLTGASVPRILASLSSSEESEHAYRMTRIVALMLGSGAIVNQLRATKAEVRLA